MAGIVCSITGVLRWCLSSVLRAVGIRWCPSEEIPRHLSTGGTRSGLLSSRVPVRPPVRLWFLVCLCVGIPLWSVITVIMCVSSRNKSWLILLICVYLSILGVTRIGSATLHSGIRLPCRHQAVLDLWSVIIGCIGKGKRNVLLCLLATSWIRVKIDMYGGQLCIVVRLGSLRQRVKADMNRLRLAAALGRASLYENVRILLLCVWECVCILSIGLHESRVVNAIMWIWIGVLNSIV